ncbi:hypothetical protein ABEG18_05885 [Alsobacter sp. KACC 23698]|uniref:Uncharacterized protein n=1 Tax=Alsobacter sp. KACC 23698 TaxID=3149229 RepID=A0AAU7JJG6_9HYPH
MAAVYALLSIAGALAGGVAGGMLGGPLWGLGGAVLGGNGFALLAGALIASRAAGDRTVTLDEHADAMVGALRDALLKEADASRTETLVTIKDGKSRRSQA